ncbi:tripartite motif-containing protein 75-like [Leptodactylus fuscus]|uniref:tripartite motif-containing protein 75-like n=1 Tax=Leptodactylus fuscus TaxID=238119 RepID=UPI003F4EA256
MALAVWRKELTCCICLDIYTGPVTLLCGHSFCMECIQDTFKTQKDNGVYSCPECRTNFKSKPKLLKNLRLNNIVETLRATQSETGKDIPCTFCIQSIVPAIKTCFQCEASLCAVHMKVHNPSSDHVLMEPTTISKDLKCSTHNKILEYYCTHDATWICVSCRLDGDHRGHLVETLHEASVKKKQELRTIKEKMSSQRKLIEVKIQTLRQRKQKIHDTTVNLKEWTFGFFREITDQVKALEKEVLGELSMQSNLMLLSVSEMIHQLEVKNKKLLAQIMEAEQFCANADLLDVLRKRTQYYNLNIEDASLPITSRLDEGPVSLILHTGLRHIANVWLERAKSRFPQKIETCKILLDAKTAHHNILLSSDLTCASYSTISMNYPDGPERFRSQQVLSSSTFCSGKHYWEVDVSKAPKWVIGMAYHSIERKINGDQSYIGYNNKSWGLTFRTYLSALYNKTHWKIHLEAPPQSVGIYLDHGAGRLSFYGLQPVQHLHTFTTKFTEPLCAAFYVFEDSCIRIKS